MHTCIHTCIHTCMHAYIHTYIRTCHACMPACMHVYTHIHTCIHTYIHTYVPLTIFEPKTLTCWPLCASHALQEVEAIAVQDKVHLEAETTSPSAPAPPRPVPPAPGPWYTRTFFLSPIDEKPAKANRKNAFRLGFQVCGAADLRCCHGLTSGTASAS